MKTVLICGIGMTKFSLFYWAIVSTSIQAFLRIFIVYFFRFFSSSTISHIFWRKPFDGCIQISANLISFSFSSSGQSLHTSSAPWSINWLIPFLYTRYRSVPSWSLFWLLPNWRSPKRRNSNWLEMIQSCSMKTKVTHDFGYYRLFAFEWGYGDYSNNSTI